ncbi:helix-turn-helix domain-containing protein [Rhizomicrobium electricum]|uniref:Helix-turn-helix transcriptional regulator n=1 Tax=Rhizomicrobium electricum TaxID=480070 RepID=A0ABP3P9L1_9PROT|nr:helix-turn-helix transcriptional regulator [Rhizomicrobium electricum]NIJ47874.1 transcriptional regulator with XRE-family HTH domain [Rhizomicrobium electricum]
MENVITSGQIRAARALLRWSAQQLADKSGTGVATVLRLEQQEGVPTGRSHTLLDLQKTLESAGVEFIGTPDDKPGVRLVKPGKRAKARTP